MLSEIVKHATTHSVGGTELSKIIAVNTLLLCLQTVVELTSLCLYMFHLSQEWTKLEKSEEASWPVERSAHAACCLNYGEEHPQLLVTGGLGKNNDSLQDAWILDVKSREWREVCHDE